MRDARINTIGEGANDVLQAFIAVVGMRGVGEHLKGVLDALKHPFKDFGTLVKFGRAASPPGSHRRTCRCRAAISIMRPRSWLTASAISAWSYRSCWPTCGSAPAESPRPTAMKNCSSWKK